MFPQQCRKVILPASFLFLEVFFPKVPADVYSFVFRRA